jgi:RNA polymerase sigma-70 factor (ECF subfamily)
VAGLLAERPSIGALDEAERAVPWERVVETVHLQMRSLVGPTGDVEDLTQAALEQVVKSVDRFEGRAALATFTYRICAHVAMNHWRWWRRWLRRFERDALAKAEAKVEPADAAQSASEQLLEAERARRLYAALDRLEPKRRLVVTLSDLEELPASRVAEIVECPEATVRSRLRKGRQELFEALRGDQLFAKEDP